MRYHLIAVGKLKRGFYQSGCDHFLKRLQAYAEAHISEVKEGRSRNARTAQSQEAAALLNAADGYRICLDERGRRFDSSRLAAHVSELEMRAISRLNLLIGGADGLDEALKEGADELWSLSPLTFPHEMARLILLEQLYRIETLRAGHPYHRD